jgi:hypothetical protein
LRELRIADLTDYNTSLFRTDRSIFVVTAWVSSLRPEPLKASHAARLA